MIPQPPLWRVNAYAVGLALHAPEDVATVLVETFTDAERIAARNCAIDTPAERAMHAVWVRFRARQALFAGDEDLARWLDHAADLLVDDWGLDAGKDLARGKREAGAT